MNDEEEHPHDKPNNCTRSVDDSVRNIPIRVASGRGIHRLEPTIGEKTHNTKTGIIYFKFE